MLRELPEPSEVTAVPSPLAQMTIDERLAAKPRARGLAADRRAALSHAFAGALLSMMFWSLDSGNASSPQAMDTLFHMMVWSTVDAARFPS